MLWEPVATGREDEGVIHLRELVRLRWGAVFAQAAVLAAVLWLAPDEVAVGRAVAVVVANALANAALEVARRRVTRVPRGALVIILVADIATLTLLLALTGGPFNPFTFLYLVHVSLAAVVLGGAGAWAVAVIATVAYGLLFLFTDVSRHHHEHMALHLKGMWVAFIVAAGLVCLFVNRVQRAVRRARDLEARHTRLASLATLAGGAAHELSTPLATIGVAAEELLRKLDPGDARSGDARLVLEQVSRCRAILEQLALDGGHAASDAIGPLSLRALVDMALEGVRGRERVIVEIVENREVTVPGRAVAGALRGLVRNALVAGPGEVSVVAGPGLAVAVVDHGAGIPAHALAHVGEPFFTTRAPGEGMGLGVFVARSLAEQLGGALELTSTPGVETRAVWRFR